LSCARIQPTWSPEAALFEKEFVALCLEHDGVRAIQIVGKDVVRWGARPLQSDWTQDGRIRDIQEVGSTIDKLMDEEHLSRKRVVVGITGLRSISRLVTFPRMQGSLLNGAVMREAKREMPMPLDEVYLSWQTVSDSGTDQQIFMLGVPRENVDSAVESLRTAGIRADGMDIKPLALARAVGQSTAVVVGVESDSLEAAIVVDDVPMVIRAVCPVSDGGVSADKMHLMAEELASTIRFYNDNHKDAQLAPDTPLFLTGGLTVNPALRQVMESSFPYPIVSIEPAFRCPAGFPVPQFAANLGLAMKQL
jgi:hypothetical protein